MSRIVLTEEQVRAIPRTDAPVEVADPSGQRLGSLTLFTPEELAALERYQREKGKRGPSVSGERVQAFLRKLHEAEEQGSLDEGKVKELLERTQAGEPL